MAINHEEVGELVDRVVHINRVAKVVKGGRRFSFSALVVVGDEQRPRRRRPRQGQRGSRGDPQGHRAGARRTCSRSRSSGGTIPHEVARALRRRRRCCSARPRAGTGVIAGGAVRAVVEVAGHPRHPHQVHRHVEPAQRRPRDRRRRCSSCAAAEQIAARARQADGRADAPARAKPTQGADGADRSVDEAKLKVTQIEQHQSAVEHADASTVKGLGLARHRHTTVVVDEHARRSAA